MEVDDYREAWQSQSSKFTVNTDLLLQEVRRNRRDFRSTLMRSSVIELAITLILIPTWVYLGILTSSHWTWYLMIPVLLWELAFLVAYRMRLAAESPSVDESLLECIESSLVQVERQIRLCRNIFWWCLLPPGIAIEISVLQSIWSRSDDWLDLIGHLDMFVFVIAIYYFTYCMTQHVRRTQLEPRRDELLTLLARLSDDSDNDPPAMPIANCAERPREIKQLAKIGCICLAIPVAFAVFGDWLDARRQDARQQERVERESFAKKAPFDGVRWQSDQPLVRLDSHWFRLVSLNGLASDEIIAFCKHRYEDQWQKRFSEDLVEVLTRLGHPPASAVTLELQSLDRSEITIRENVPMTEENRDAIYSAEE